MLMSKRKKERKDRAIPLSFEADIQKAQQFEDQRRQNPLATISLVQLYNQILDRLPPNESPILYALIKRRLGNVYLEVPTGDRSTNLARAITYFQEALRFYTPETAPFDYAMTQHNLGTAYRDLPTGDRAANLEQAITCFQE